MHEKLAHCYLPVDDLLKEMVETESLEREMQFITPRFGTHPVDRLVTLDLVTNKKIVNVARKYISKLLGNREKYGYIYYLYNQRMLHPLNVRFQGVEVFVDWIDKEEIVAAMEKLASEISCKMTMMHDITMMELYYFFIRLVNPHLTWIAVESMINSVRGHAHLIMSPERKYSYRMTDDDEWKEKTCKSLGGYKVLK